MIPVALHYDALLSRANTWRLLEDRGGIRARIRVASGPEVTAIVRVRHRAGKAPGLVFCRPVDDCTFQCESTEIDPALPRVELVLTGAPESAAAVLRSL